MADNASTALFCLEAHPLQQTLCEQLDLTPGHLEHRHFPDGETYLRVSTPVRDADCLVLADLSHPDAKYLAHLFLFDTLRELGARSVGLVAPYLCYMRQDCRFEEGEAVTSRVFARTLSRHIDWLVTVDPHLHRYDSLDEIYSVPSEVVAGAPALAEWLGEQKHLLLVGPDAESEQWVSGIARASGHPFVVATKQRLGDRQVRVSLPDITPWQDHKAVIIDDVISSGQTIAECIRALKAQGIARVSCAAVHGIFADGSDRDLLASGLDALVTTNTLPHETNGIDVTELLVPAIRRFLSRK